VRLAIIGAGVAGLTAAYYLRHMPSAGPRLDVTVYEKEGEIGGRLATRREHGTAYDYGAQYFKTDTPAISELIRTELPTDALLDIKRDVWTFDRDGFITPGDAAQNQQSKWTYLDGNARLARHLGRGTEVRTGARVGRLGRRPGGSSGYQVQDTQGRPLGEADMVLIAVPAAQAAELVARSDLDDGARATLVDRLAAASYDRVLSIVLGYEWRLKERPYYALVNSDKGHDISWLAFEHDKGPARVPATRSVVIVQMGALYSTANYEEPAASVVPRVAALASALLEDDLRTPAWSDLQRWRYALPRTLVDPTGVQEVAPHLFFAGDYLAGPRVHLAMESGRTAAARIAARGAPVR